MAKRSGDERSGKVNASKGDTKGRVNWDSSNLRTSYADSFDISATREELTLFFGTSPVKLAGKEDITGRITNRIILNPQSAKRTVHLLKDFMEAYEVRYGSLERPVSSSRGLVAVKGTLPLWDDGGEEILRLTNLVQDLDVPFGFERSFKMSKETLLDRRFLMSLTKGSLGIDGQETVYRVCRQLDMPEQFNDIFAQNLFKASYCHFGYDESTSSVLYKAYLEFWTDWEQEISNRPERREPYLLFLGFKWDASDPNKRALTRYTCHPWLTVEDILDKITTIYGSEDDPACSTARNILEMAAARVSAEKILYLEVTEEDNPRMSFDVNLYRSGLPMRIIFPLVLDLGRYYGIEEDRLRTTLEAGQGKKVGHISGGMGRDGKSFFTVYYGVEGH